MQNLEIVYRCKIVCPICGPVLISVNNNNNLFCPNDKNHIVDSIIEGIDVLVNDNKDTNIDTNINTDINTDINRNINTNINTDINTDIIINIDLISSVKSDTFFDCFNEENSVNNVIACDSVHNKSDQLTTSYMFENEDLRKNDIYPFANGYYKKPERKKGWLESLGMVTTSAMMIFGAQI